MIAGPGSNSNSSVNTTNFTRNFKIMTICFRTQTKVFLVWEVALYNNTVVPDTKIWDCSNLLCKILFAYNLYLSSCNFKSSLVCWKYTRCKWKVNRCYTGVDWGKWLESVCAEFRYNHPRTHYMVHEQDRKLQFCNTAIRLGWEGCCVHSRVCTHFIHSDSL